MQPSESPLSRALRPRAWRRSGRVASQYREQGVGSATSSSRGSRDVEPRTAREGAADWGEREAVAAA